MSEGLRFRRESAPFNLYVDTADAVDDGKGNKSWTLNLPKNLGPEDFIGAIITVKEPLAENKIMFNNVMSINSTAISATTIIVSGNGTAKLVLAYMPADGETSVGLTAAS